MDLNKIKDLNAFKDSICSVIDDRINEVKRWDAVDRVGKLNIGEIKYIMENVYDKLYSTKEGQKSLTKYMKSLNENKSIKRFYSISNVLSGMNGVKSPDSFINEALAMKKKLSDTGKFYSCVKNCIKESEIGLDEMNDILDQYNNSISKNISYVLLEGKSIKNLKEYNDNVSVIKESISKEAETVENPFKDTNLYESLTDVMANCPTEWGKSAINDYMLCLMSNGSKEELFETYKNKCKDSINEKLEECDNPTEKSRYFALSESLNSKTYNEETFTDDLLKLSELNETINS